MQAHIMTLQIPQNVELGQKVKTYYVMLHIKLKERRIDQHRRRNLVLTLNIHLTLSQVVRSDIEFAQINVVYST